MSEGFGGYGSTAREYTDDPSGRRQPYRSNPFTARRPGTGYQGSDYDNFNELSDQISSNIFTINNNATSLERALRQIGTPKDSMNLRDKMHSMEQDTNRVINETAVAFRRLNSLCTRAERQQKLQYERLKNEFQDSAQRYNTLQKKVAEKVKATVFSSATRKDELISWQDNPSDQARLLEDEERREQQMAQLQTQGHLVDTDLALIAERQERIAQLEGDILDINEIFRDLGTMVHEQGEVIDTIEANVEGAYQHVEDGNQQLIQAARFQRKYRKKMCCLVITLLIVAGVVALIVYLSVRGK